MNNGEWKVMSLADLEVLARRKTDELVAIRTEIERRKGIGLASKEVNFEKYVSED